MARSVQTNRRVKDRIVAALLDLMEEENYSEITVTQIVARAGVARQSYYRNFTSKDGIVEAFYLGMHEKILARLQAEGEDLTARRRVTIILRVLKEHRQDILCLYRGGFSTYNLEMINEYIEQAAGTMSATSLERYQVYCFAGAVYNTGLVWLMEGAKESEEEVADMICGFRAADLVFDPVEPVR